MNFKAQSYPYLAAICYAIFAAFGFATWHALLFVAVPAKTSTMATLQGLLTLEPGAPLLRFHAASTVAAAVFAIFLYLRPLATGLGRLIAAVVAAVFAATLWAVFKSDTALLPTVAVAALAMNYMQATKRSAR